MLSAFVRGIQPLSTNHRRWTRFFYSLTLTAISFLCFRVLKPIDKRLGLFFGLAFAVYVGLDDLVTGLPSALPAFRFVEGDWNWSGKVYSLVLAVAVIRGFGISARSAGLVMPTRNVRTASLVLIPLVAFGVFLGFMFKPDVPSGETLAFQLLMPGLAEELAYRGVALALLLGLIRGENPPEEIPWLAIVIAAIPFGVVHGLGYADGAFSFDVLSASYPFTGGIIYGWLRFSTGSLLFPLLAHSLANVAFVMTAFL